MKLLLATDGTKESAAAIDMLKNFALRSGDSIEVVTVIDMAVPTGIDLFGGYLPDTSQLEATARETASRLLEETVEKLKEVFSASGVSIDSDVLFGSPDSRIVETAERNESDLIIVGSHAHGRWERLLIGSISNSVVHHAPCSVLVVRS